MQKTQITKESFFAAVRLAGAFLIAGFFIAGALSISIPGHASVFSAFGVHIAHAQDGGGDGGGGGGDGGGDADAGGGGGCCGGEGNSGVTGDTGSPGGDITGDTPIPPVMPPPTCPVGTTGTYPNCVVPSCPPGTTGTPPNCTTTNVCPPGTTGTPPNCTTTNQCPPGTTGTPPNCITNQCPPGTTGTPPNCHGGGCTSNCNPPVCNYNCDYNPPEYPPYSFFCPPGYMGSYPNCYYVYGGQVAYAAPTLTQTISLAQVPYTGLDLGPIGTALYWAFLAVWAALGTYLVVVKRVQDSIARKLEEYFFEITA